MADERNASVQLAQYDCRSATAAIRIKAISIRI
jgi:hypothetical protein